MIYHMIIRQVRNLIGIKSLTSRGFNDSFIQKSLGISPFELRKVKGFARNFSLEELLAYTILSSIWKLDRKAGPLIWT